MLSETVEPAAPPVRARVGVDQLAGAGGLVFVALLLIQNAVRASGPSFTATPTAVTTYFADHRAAAIVPLTLFPLGMVAILCFAAPSGTVAIAEGSHWLYLGYLGFAVWALLLRTAGSALLRSADRRAGRR